MSRAARQPVRASTLWSVGALLVLWLAVIAGGLLRHPLLGLVVGLVVALFFMAGWARARWRERLRSRDR